MATTNHTRRKAYVNAASSLYTYDAPHGDHTCTYCGAPCDTVDHIIPLVHMAHAMTCQLANFPSHYGRGLKIVPACRECNSLASDALCFSVTEKRKLVQERLRRKHWRLLGEYDWHAEELAELGDGLRDYVEGQEMRRQWLLMRLRWPRE